jgi:chemotaxis protein CheD
MTAGHQVYVQPGEVRWSVEPCVFKTVLGSCISVCLWDPVHGIGGLTHFILPHDRAATGDTRFADVAVPRLAGKLRGLGCSMLVAKVFGGAAVLPKGHKLTVGDSNTEAALALLREQRIDVVAQRTGGDHGIVLQFFTASGAVQVREIKGPHVAILREAAA